MPKVGDWRPSKGARFFAVYLWKALHLHQRYVAVLASAAALDVAVDQGAAAPADGVGDQEQARHDDGQRWPETSSDSSKTLIKYDLSLWISMSPTVTQNGNSLQLTAVSDGDDIIPSRPKELRFYTIGYEGRTLDNFVSRLKSNGIKQLVDVRERPFSRKKGFSQKPLRERLEQEGIRYIHMLELGSPADLRHEYKSGGSEIVFFNKYKKYVEENEMDEVGQLEKIISCEPSAIMCFELTYCHCHRRVLADFVVSMGHEVVHL